MITQDLIDGQFGATYDEVYFSMTPDVDHLLTEATIYIQLRKILDGPIFKTFSVEDGLTIVNDSQFKIDEHIITIPVGNYIWDALIIFPDDEPRTPIGGKWAIKNVVTKI